MRRLLLIFPALLLACTHAPALTEPADAPAVTHATYTCENGVKLAVMFPESGNAFVKADAMAEMELKAMMSASGNRFSNGRYELWTKGMDEALWTVGRMEPVHCTAP